MDGRRDVLRGLAAACAFPALGAGMRAEAQAVTAVPPSPPQDLVVQPPLPALATGLATALAARPVNGAFLFARGDEVLLSRAFGQGAGHRLTTATPFPVASVSKQLTAAAFLRLAERGRVTLETPLGRVFPEAATDKARLTFERLLTHTSGLPANAFDIDAVVTREQARDAILALPLHEGRYEYSNADYMLVAMAVERLSGLTIDVALKRWFFDPLGMRMTGYPSSRFSKAGVAVAVPNGIDPYVGNPLMEPGITGWYRRGAGGLISTVGDVDRWRRGLVAGQVLSAGSVERLFTGRSAVTDELKYGYGLLVRETPQGRIVSHTGGWHRYQSEFWLMPERGLFAVGLTNDRGAAFDDTWQRALGVMTASLSPV